MPDQDSRRFARLRLFDRDPIMLAAGDGWLAFRLTNDLVYVFIALAVLGSIDAAAAGAGAWFGKTAR